MTPRLPRTDGTETLDGLTGAGFGAGESCSAEAVLASHPSVSGGTSRCT